MKRDFVFTSDSVTAGHPDKLCDQISDGIVDRFVTKDPFARVIAECALASGVLFIATQFRAEEAIDVVSVAREVINGAGYKDKGFNGSDCTIMSNFHELPVLGDGEFSAEAYTDGDPERIVATHPITLFGYACNHNPASLPQPIWAAHQLARHMDQARSTELPYLQPDGLTQVSIEYHNRRPKRVRSVTLISSQDRDDSPPEKQVIDDLRQGVMLPAFDAMDLKVDTKTLVNINPQGPLLTGGPNYHAGLTGRKSAIDTYGQFSRHSSSALSGKDPSRVERIGSYFARYVAKHVVSAGLADECELLLSYTVGQSSPVSVQIDTFDTANVDEDELLGRVLKTFDFRVGAIIHHFQLHQQNQDNKNFFRQLACYGHMGRIDLMPPWEVTERTEQLKTKA